MRGTPAATAWRRIPLRVTMATEPGTAGWPNEDFAAAAPGAAVLLDGATQLPGADSGCAHGVAWFARSLGAARCWPGSPRCPASR
jgi:hypothetical protein